MITHAKPGTAMVLLNSEVNRVPPFHVAVMIGVRGHDGCFGLLWSEDLTRTLLDFDTEAAGDPSGLSPAELADAIVVQATEEIAEGKVPSLPAEALMWSLLRLKTDPKRKAEAALREVVTSDGCAIISGLVESVASGRIAVKVHGVAAEDREPVH